MYNALLFVIVGVCGLALWLGIRRAHRLRSGDPDQSVFTTDLFPSFGKRLWDRAATSTIFGETLDGWKEVLGEVAASLFLLVLRSAFYLAVLYGLVKFVK